MLTEKRFRRLVESYGANLQHWPRNIRGGAERLLDRSARARALLEAARGLDDVIEAASTHEAAILLQPQEMNAALARLRANVGAQIASPAAQEAWKQRFAPSLTATWPIFSGIGWIGISSVGGLAIAAGLLIGTLYQPESRSVSALAMLMQPAPIHILTN